MLIQSDALFVTVYSELKRLATQRLRALPAGRTIHATVLVHEAYLKLVKYENLNRTHGWINSSHFFAVASEAMRTILIDHYRRKKTEKRGGLHTQIFENVADFAAPQSGFDLLELDEVLNEFGLVYPEKAQIVKLRFYVGMTMPEIAQALQLSITTVERHWRFSRAWLAERIEHVRECNH